MNTIQTLAALTCMAFLLPAQEAKAPSPPPEVTIITKGLEDLSAEVDALQDRVLAALERAKSAKTPEAADALYAEVVQLGKRIAELGAKASALRADVNPLKARIEAAMKLPTAREVLATLQKLENSTEEAADGGDEHAAGLLGIVRYKLAEFTRQEAVKEGAPRSDAWNQAAGRFAEVLECSDSPDPSIGPSLHAAALAKIVECKVTLYLGFKASSPPSAASMGAMKRYRREAREAFDRLKRGYPEKESDSQGKPLDIARGLIDQIK